MKIKYISYILLLIIMTFSVNGLCDFLLYLKVHINEQTSKKIHRQQTFASLPKGIDINDFDIIFNDTQKLEYESIPFVGKVIKPGNYGTYRINDDRRRVITEKLSTLSTKTNSLLLLGSSQGFGYYAKDRESFANQLARELPTFDIDNYTTPAQTTLQTLAYWHKITIDNPHKHYDIAIILNGPFDYISECRNAALLTSRQKELSDRESRPAISNVYRKFVKRFLPDKNKFQNQCVLPAEQKAIAHQTIAHLKDIISYGERSNIATLAIIPPALWGNNANIENIRPLLIPEEENIFRKISRTQSSLAEGIENIISLSHLFDNKKEQFFLDQGAHLTPKGSELMTKVIANHIKKKLNL